MSNNTFADHKLIILYFLSSINSSINLSDITNFLIEKNYTDYMGAGNLLGELENNGLITVIKKDNKVLYKMNEQGKQTLEMFADRMPAKDKEVIDEYLEDFKDLSTNSLHTSFTSIKNDDQSIDAICTLSKDKNALFEIKVPNISENELSKVKEN
ncbi:MAG: DUF4364 family protein [Clostridia bacterium]|nr:DUF4364 family protein [Clostridia bacterium]